jgi:hypothetical protein
MYRSYLDPICQYLNDFGATRIMLEFLLFIKDDIRCGLGYIKMFHEETEIGMQISYLQNAKGSSKLVKLKPLRVIYVILFLSSFSSFLGGFE